MYRRSPIILHRPRSRFQTRGGGTDSQSITRKMSMESLWMVTVPNRDGVESKSTYSSISRGLKSADSSLFTDLAQAEVPELSHGTLDSLVSLSDELVKTNIQVETVVKKIERQYFDIQSGADGETAPLRVHDKSTNAYLAKWSWDYARYQHQGRKLSDLISQITSQTAYADEELKKLVGTHSEKLSNLSNWQRKKTINLGTSDFEDFLTPKTLSGVEIVSNDHLITLMVSMMKDLETEFLANYSNSDGWAQDIASYGPSEDKDSVKGSPVVPKSAVKVFENQDQVLYAITVLRGHTKPGTVDLNGNYTAGELVDYVEPLRAAFRDKRCTVRPLVFDASKATGVESNIEKASAEVEKSVNVISRWCSAHFGEIYSAFVHLRVISAYVESVMRYGVPVNFVVIFMKPDGKRGKEAQHGLTAQVLKVQPSLVRDDDDLDDVEEEDNPDDMPYVCAKIPILGTGAQ